MFVEPLVECPECHQPKLIKLISGGAAVIVRGTENPCKGSRVKKNKPKHSYKPFWRDGPVDKRVLKNPEKYIREGVVD